METNQVCADFLHTLLYPCHRAFNPEPAPIHIMYELRGALFTSTFTARFILFPHQLPNKTHISALGANELLHLIFGFIQHATGEMLTRMHCLVPGAVALCALCRAGLFRRVPPLLCIFISKSICSLAAALAARDDKCFTAPLLHPELNIYI
jgi:hypothetical protein